MSTGKHYQMFDILGPIMIGPSSSHTAGACRLANMARRIYGAPLRKVICELHGSFSHTYLGHGSDRAVAGGLLGLAPDDERLVDALRLIADKGIDLAFMPKDLGNVHPNTMRFRFIAPNEPEFTVTGSSIGGGNIRITDIDGTATDFTGEYPTLILRYPDSPGMVYAASGICHDNNLNIAHMHVNRLDQTATMIIELDEPFTPRVTDAFQKLPQLDFFKAIAR